MRVIWRDKKLPHQLHVEVDHTGMLYAKCNCGIDILSGKTLHGQIMIQIYRQHMEDVAARAHGRARQ